MPLIQGAYQPPALNPLLVPVSDAPPVDTDPYSPTYGQPTFSNLKPRANTPDVGTTAKGNPGQPAPGVPTTDVPNASPPLPNVDATFTMAPAGAPKAEPKTPAKAAADVPDYLGNAKPQVDEHGKSLQAQPAPTQPADGDVPDYLGNATPQVDTHGQPATPAYTGQYLTSGTSAGAQAVGTPPVEGFVPGAAVQAAINTATDPGQRAAIAAKQLGIPLDRIIVDAGGGRMAAVGDSGTPYYITPQPFFRDQSGITRGAPGEPWQPMGPLQVTPYSRAGPIESPSFNEAMSRDIAPNIGAALPGTVSNALTYVPAAVAETVGGPTAGAVTAGGMRYATGAVQQMIANALTPNQSNKQPVFTSQLGQDALLDALLWRGGSLVGKAFAPAAEPNQLGVGGVPGFGRLPIERQQPYGLQDTLAPWEAPQRWELPPGPLTPPGNPPGLPPPGARILPPAVSETPAISMPVPGAVPPAAGERPAGMPAVQLNPAGEAATLTGPYAGSTSEEIARIPEAIPPLRTPIMSQAGAEARADQIIRHFAANGPTEADSRVLIPGSPGSLAQVTGNAGIATLERAVRNLPEAANIFNALDTAQQEARRTAVAQLVGTPEDLARLTAARDAATSRARETAFAKTAPTDPSEAVAAIDQVLAGPEGKRPGVAQPLQMLRRLFYTTDAETGAQVLDTDPAMLYGVRKAITDSLSPLARGTEADARAASSLLQPVLQKLDAAIEAGAPGYRGYMQTFAQQSKPIDAMEYLQSRNLTDAQGNPTLAKVDLALKDIQRQRTLQAGARPADALSADQIASLEDLRDDLRRQANLAKGKALGSNTVQNLAGNQAMNLLTRPAAQVVGRGVGAIFGGLPGYLGAEFAENALTGVAARAEARVRQALIDRLLNREGLGVRALQARP